MNPAKAELARIVEVHELSDQARIALEKLVSHLHKEKKAVQDKLVSALHESDACNRAALAANAEASRLRVEKESLAQQLSGKDSTIARLQECVARFEANLLQQQERGYNVPMIEDFLDQLMHDLRCVVWEHEHANAANPDLIGPQKRYFDRYGQIGGFVPVSVRESGDSHHRKELLSQYRPELAALELLAPRFKLALEAAKRRTETFVMNVTEPDKSHWTPCKEFVKRVMKLV